MYIYIYIYIYIYVYIYILIYCWQHLTIYKLQIFIAENTVNDSLKSQGRLLKLLSFIRDFYSSGILIDQGIYKKTNVSIYRLGMCPVFF